MRLYKRNAQGKPLFWSIDEDGHQLVIEYGLVGGTKHHEVLDKTMVKANEYNSRINAKRKEGYKELSEVKDNIDEDWAYNIEAGVFRYNSVSDKQSLINILNLHLPVNNTTSEGFVLPMLAKTLKDNKPFDKFGDLCGQYKINGVRCLIGATKSNDLFSQVCLTYHSRLGEDWTKNMSWMDDIILPKLNKTLIDLMVEEGVYLDGELYIPGYTINFINQFVKNPTLKEHYLLQYWCFDICIESASFERRCEIREKNIDGLHRLCLDKMEHLNNKNQLIIVPTIPYIDSYNTAITYRDKFVDLGFEGLICRNPNGEYQFGKRNAAMFKFKQIDDGKFKIIDIKSEHKRSNLPLFVLQNDINNSLFECSINKPHSIQEEYLINKDNYIGKYAFVEFRERSGVNQVPFHARIVDICLK